jgi:hypothetical protein
MQGAALLAAAGALPIGAEGLEMVTVQVDTANIVGPLPHVWRNAWGLTAQPSPFGTTGART